MPDTRTPADRARELAPRCAGYSDPSGGQVLAPAAVDSVEPAYPHVQSGVGSWEARLRGARIHARPLPGLSRESMQRSLECHQAAVVLGKAGTVPDDPDTLPNRWLDIDVDSDGDGFVVQSRVDSFDDAREILARALRRGRRASKSLDFAGAVAERARDTTEGPRRRSRRA